MTGTDWLLFLHVLSAVLLGGAMTAFWALVLGTRPEGAALTPGAAARLNGPYTVVVSIGTLGTVVFGVWLALVVDRYEIWDAWIVAALVLWAAATELGRRAGVALAAGAPQSRRNGILLHGLSSVGVVVILALMIWKPGA